MTIPPEDLTPKAVIAMMDAARRAGGEGLEETEPKHVLAALASVALEPGRLHTALRGREATLRSIADGQARRGSFTPLGPAVRQLVGEAREMARTTGERTASTLHLMAALAARDDRDLGLSAEAVLIWAARTRDATAQDDFAAEVPAGRSPLTAALDLAPQAMDLHRRTTGRRSAFLAGLYKGQLPSGDRVSTPLGRRRMRAYLNVTVIQYLAAAFAVVLTAEHAVSTGNWWMLPLVLVFGVTPINAGVTAIVLTRAPILLLAPPIVCVFALVSMIGAVFEIRYMVWMLRVDRAEPALGYSTMWRSYWKQNQIMTEQWMERVLG